MNSDFNQFLSRLKERTDIVTVASRYLTLEQKGRNYWACCPFHGEKTASFSINPIDGFYHCFGCGKSGDVINFVMEVETCDFMTAVSLLAASVGMEVPTFKGHLGGESNEEKKKQRARIYELLKCTALFYYKNLFSSGGEKARAYLSDRGVSEGTINRFGIGCSVDYNSLVSHLNANKFTKEEMLLSGVIEEKDGRLFDALGTRLVIPIIDAFGQVVAFGGRVLVKTDFAKYKNTKETIAFSKSKTLYGLNLIKKQKLSEGIKSLIVVEGYMDAISLYEAGFKNVVASMGTSLTAQQAKLIKYVTKDVFISYDGDDAGLAAAVRGLDILTNEDLNVKVVYLPDKMDPDDVIKKKGSEFYADLVKNALPLIDFKILMLKEKFDLSDNLGKRNFIKEAVKLISNVESKAEQEDVIKNLSKMVKISADAIYEDLTLFSNKQTDAPEKKGGLREVDETTIPQKPTAIVKAIRFLLYYAMEKKLDPDKVKGLNEVTLPPFEKAVAKYIKENHQSFSKSDLFHLCQNEEERQSLLEILELNERENINEKNIEKYYQDTQKSLIDTVLKEQLAKLNLDYASTIDTLERSMLMAEIAELTRKIRQRR